MFRKFTVAVMALAVVVGGCLVFFGWLKREEEKRGFGTPLAGPDGLYSNILPEDYVGPDACANCHKTNYMNWSQHPHRFMNQLASHAAIKGDFADHDWKVRPGFTVTFTTQGTDYWISVDQAGRERTRYKVTRTVGSRFMQFYIGVQTEGAEPPGDRVYTTEHRLPFGYWFRMKRWLPVDYFDVRRDGATEEVKDGFPVVEGVDKKASFHAYTDSCVHCHNTYPHAYRIFRPTTRGFQDAIFNPDFVGLSAVLADKVTVEPNAAAFAHLPFRLDPNKDLVTVGISCEGCHLGGREHASFQKAISFFPTNPHVQVTSRSATKRFRGERNDPATSQGICMQCHSTPTVENYPNGASIRNSSESNDLNQGACTTKISCVSCHEPHTVGTPSGGPALSKHLLACVNCHAEYSTQEKSVAHGRHAAELGVTCLDCHMPRISQGLDEVTRTHRISLPVEQSMISKGAPNACNLCHLDKSVQWSLDELKRGWGRDIRPLAKTPPEYLEQPSGLVWLKSHQPITKMVATDAYARSPFWKDNLGAVMGSLNDPHGPNRAFALFAVERILGRPLGVSEIDILEGPAQRRKQIDLLQNAILKMK